MKVEHAMPWRTFDIAQIPASRFNGMIYPLLPISNAGVIWYQGESDAGKPEAYAGMLKDLICGWRNAWGDASQAWVVAQLPQFGLAHEHALLTSWAKLRASQADATMLDRTYLAITLDQGRSDDIHPRSKQVIGERMALQALKHVYARSVAADGPQFSKLWWHADRVDVRFRTEEGSELARNESVAGFEVLTAEEQWLPAIGKVTAPNRISVKTNRPILGIRYGWLEAEAANIFDTAGLPAAPFSHIINGTDK